MSRIAVDLVPEQVNVEVDRMLLQRAPFPPRLESIAHREKNPELVSTAFLLPYHYKFIYLLLHLR